MEAHFEMKAVGGENNLPLEKYLDLLLQKRQLTATKEHNSYAASNRHARVEKLFADIESARIIVERKRLQAETDRASITLQYLRLRESCKADSLIVGFNGKIDGLLDARCMIMEELKQLDEMKAMLSRNKADLDEIRMGTKVALDNELFETVKASLKAVKMMKAQRAM